MDRTNGKLYTAVIFTKKKISICKWTNTVHTCVVQWSAVICQLFKVLPSSCLRSLFTASILNYLLFSKHSEYFFADSVVLVMLCFLSRICCIIISLENPYLFFEAQMGLHLFFSHLLFPQASRLSIRHHHPPPGHRVRHYPGFLHFFHDPVIVNLSLHSIQDTSYYIQIELFPITFIASS